MSEESVESAANEFGPYSEAEVVAAQDRVSVQLQQAQNVYLQNRVVELEILLERAAVECESLRVKLQTVEQFQFDQIVKGEVKDVSDDVGPDLSE